ncbi:MAG: dihydrolipoamide acetyltransferase family protein [Candidatus Bathyarchaeia archaeon]
MQAEVVLPKLDRIMREAVITKWTKANNEEVKQGEVIAIIETEKATAEVTSPASGILKILKPEGTTVPVGEVIAVIEEAPPETPKEEVKVEVLASPRAKSLAKAHGIDLTKVRGTGPRGMITEKDLLPLISEIQRAAAPAEKAVPIERVVPVERLENVEIIPLRGWRKDMAERMALSMRTVAHVTTFAEADVTKLLKLREDMRKQGYNISLTAFVAKAVVQALKKYPILNSSLEDDKIIIKKYYNIGIAVYAGERGLTVPVIRDADKLNLKQLSEAVDKLAEKARRGEISLEDVVDGTFTITNVGMFGALFNTPIINYPQVAILGVGAVKKRPVVVDDKIEIRSMAYLCLTYDHRVVEGVPAVRFLQEVRALLENPEALVDF